MSSNTQYFTPVFVLALPLLAVVSDVAAQDLQEIHIIGREVNLIGAATSASQGLISRQELQLRPLLRTGEILESVPGLVATQHSGSGKANQFFLRGFNLDHGTDFSTTVDSMPINMRSHGHGQGYTDLNFIIPELVSEIQFRKGSYFADAGDFSAAGSAAMSSVSQLDTSGVSLGLGEYNFQRVLVSGSTGNNNSAFLYGLEHQRYDGPWQDISEDVGKTNLWLKQTWQREDSRLELMFMAYDNSWNAADQIPARAVDQGVITRFGSIDETVGGDSSRYSLSLNWTRNLGTGTLHAAAYGIDYDMELYSNFSYFIDPQGDQFQQIDRRKIYGGNLEWRQASTIGTLVVQNSLGVQVRVDDIDEVGLRHSARRQILGEIRMDAVQESSAGFYWQNQIHWTPRLRSVLGLRHDNYKFDVEALTAADPTTLSANSGSNSDHINTASLSVIFQVNENNEVYASMGQGFHSNDARGTTIQRDPVTGAAVSPVDPLVDTLGSEIGWRTFLTDKLNASIALWQLDIDSELIFVGDAGNTEDTGVGSSRKGVELTSYYQISNRLALDVEYSWTDSAFDHRVDGTDAIPGALSDVFSGGLSMNLNDRLQAALRVRHFDDFPLDAGAEADGSTLVNLRMSYAFSPKLTVTADVLNLLDSNDHDIEYFYESQLPGEAAPVEDHHYHVFEPRSLRVYLNYRF